MSGPQAEDRPGPLRRAVTVANLRLASGLVLFAYVALHLANHALGNVSLAAMEAGLDGFKLLWRNVPAGILLYGALAIHLALGLWALYARQRFQWTPPEVAQLALGLLLPPLLASHVVFTRLEYALYDASGGYAQQLYVFFVTDPRLGAQQALALLVAWIHGCIGIHFRLRLKPGFPRRAPLLLSGAVLLPVLALLGYLQAGRAVALLAADESWRLEYAPADPADSPEVAAQVAQLGAVNAAILTGFAALVLLALLGRLARRAAERRRGLVRLTYPDGRTVRIPRGLSVLEASRIARVPHAGVCNGRGRCSTCRVRISGRDSVGLPPPETTEAAVLGRIGAEPNIRLACQLRPHSDLAVTPLISPKAAMAVARGRAGASFGEERFVVALFVDMRGSTRLAEMRLPFDTLFIVNRFLDAVARAVRAAGGAPNQFLGDGMLALFGLEADPRRAAREGLDAVARIGDAVAALNELMRPDLPEPIRFGIGLHAGTAVLGEIGGPESGYSVFTAIGDPVNVAARLQGATKRYGAEALVSDAVYEAAGFLPDEPSEEVAIDGREGAIRARVVGRAAAMRAGESEIGAA